MRENRVLRTINRHITFFGIDRRIIALALMCAFWPALIFGSFLCFFLLLPLTLGAGYWMTHRDPELIRIWFKRFQMNRALDPVKYRKPDVAIRNQSR